jgi:hypothetical protein
MHYLRDDSMHEKVSSHTPGDGGETTITAYARGDLSIEAYLVRIIAAVCRQNNGELRVKGELIDTIGEATALLKSWDSKTQELVLTVSMGTFGEVFRVIPEKQTNAATVIRPIEREEAQPLANGAPARHGSTLDNPDLVKMEQDLLKRRIAAMLQDEFRRRKAATQA